MYEKQESLYVRLKIREPYKTVIIVKYSFINENTTN